MKRMFDTKRVTEFFIKAGLIIALTAALLLPTTVRLQSAEIPDRVLVPLRQAPWQTLPLRPIQDLETMPWLLKRYDKGMRIDTLQSPPQELPVSARRHDHFAHS